MTTRFNKQSWALILVGMALLLPSIEARADASAADKAAAEVLFDEARALLGKGETEEACRKFEGSQKLDPGIGTALFLADCYEKIGRTASAWALFREAAAMANSAGQADREQIARARAGLLETKVPKLVLVTQAVANIPGLEILRDGTVIPLEMGSSEVPVDPGKHVIELRAPTKKPWSLLINVPNTPEVQRITLPQMEDAPLPKKDDTVAPTIPEKNESGVSNGRRNVGIIVGAAGLAGLGVSGIFTGIALSKNSEADKICNGSACPSQAGVDLGNDAITAANVSTVVLGVGLAGVAVGTILFLTAPSRTAKKASSTSFMIVPTPNGVMATGRW